MAESAKIITAEELLSDFLKKNHLTLSTAESCTGGKIASMITSIPGSSQCFKGGVVSYSNEAKADILNVNASDIEVYGAVSETVVRQMSLGAKTIFGTDCSIATSGIAGPDGGTEEKPVGTVWISVRYGDQSEEKLYRFGANRRDIILQASHTAMLMLYDRMIRWTHEYIQ